ncbi:hypothetical protein Y032_0003g1653 [Ancylostoma ceylanicum]|nr:hypothetical protein Y032_0003g1653 [Ancylostoma ceylanicum]
MPRRKLVSIKLETSHHMLIFLYWLHRTPARPRKSNFVCLRKMLWLSDERISVVDGYFVDFSEGDYRERTDGLEEIGSSALGFYRNGPKYELLGGCDLFFLLPFRKLFNPPSYSDL